MKEAKAENWAVEAQGEKNKLREELDKFPIRYTYVYCYYYYIILLGII
jgi:hypothetical protein